jgi:hypothetical protein
MDPFKDLDACLEVLHKNNSAVPNGWEAYTGDSPTLSKMIQKKERIQEHSCLKTRCKDRGNIVEVDKKTYKCMVSNQIHECHADESSCKYVLENESKQTYCYISKKLIGFAHSCIENGCRAKGLIIQLSGDTFKCLLSGFTHTCTPQGTCKYRLPSNSEGMSICYVSGFAIQSKFTVKGRETELSDSNDDPDDMIIEDDSAKMSIEDDTHTNTSIGEEDDTRKKKTKVKKKGIKTIDQEKRVKKKKGAFGDINTMRHTFRNIIYDVMYNTKECIHVDNSNSKRAESAAGDCIYRYGRQSIKETKIRPSFGEEVR